MAHISYQILRRISVACKVMIRERACNLEAQEAANAVLTCYPNITPTYYSSFRFIFHYLNIRNCLGAYIHTESISDQGCCSNEVHVPVVTRGFVLTLKVGVQGWPSW